MPNINDIITEIENTFDENFIVFKNVKNIQEDLNKENKPSVLVQIINDTRDDLNTEGTAKKIRDGILAFIIYCGFNTDTDDNNDGLARTKANEIYSDIQTLFIDKNFKITIEDENYKLIIKNAIILDYLPVSSKADGKCFFGITGASEYRLIRV